MAIVYTTGTINEPDAGSVGQAMAEQIRDDFSAHAAWELVEEFTPASGAVCWYVFKCLSSASGLSDDFYVVLGRTMSTGELRFGLCEEYDAGTHTMSKYTVYLDTGNQDVASDGTWAGAFGLSTSPFPATNGHASYATWVPGGTSTKWWLILADDSFVFAANGPSNGYVHIGAYEWFGETANLLPVMLSGSHCHAGIGYMTRNPDCAGLNISAAYISSVFSLKCGNGAGPLGLSPPNLLPLGFQGYWQADDKHLGGFRSVAEVGIIHEYVTPNSIPVVGYVVGKQKNMRFSGQPTPVGFAFGDAFALNGTLWVPYLPGDGRIWNTGVSV